MVWKFDAAPAQLRRLHDSLQKPEWIVLVPREIYGLDIDAAMRAAKSARTICRYKTQRGDVVYIGDAPLQQIPALVAASDDNESHG